MPDEHTIDFTLLVEMEALVAANDGRLPTPDQLADVTTVRRCINTSTLIVIRRRRGSDMTSS